jgi:FAD binding domain
MSAIRSSLMRGRLKPGQALVAHQIADELGISVFRVVLEQLNTGVQDVHNLAWKIAAVRALKGAGNASMIDRA